MIILNSAEGDDKVVDGDTSGPGDDKKSIAKCPAGYKIKSCSITVGNVPDKSDGLLVDHDGAGTCTGFNSYLGQSVKAKGICTLGVEERNPCNGAKIQSLTYSVNSAVSPSSSCQGGYEMVGCLYHSWWSHIIRFYTIIHNYWTLLLFLLCSSSTQKDFVVKCHRLLYPFCFG